MQHIEGACRNRQAPSMHPGRRTLLSLIRCSGRSTHATGRVNFESDNDVLTGDGIDEDNVELLAEAAMADDYTEALRSMASHLDEGEADRLRELLTLLESVGDEGDWTDNSYLLMSLASPAMEEQVLQLLAHTFVGEAGKLRRLEWDERRAALRRAIESK